MFESIMTYRFSSNFYFYLTLYSAFKTNKNYWKKQNKKLNEIKIKSDKWP